MTFQETMDALEALGNPQTKSIFIKHGAKEPIYGVKVGDLKTIQKKVKKDHELSLKLFETGNADAMYLAGLIADEQLITKEELKQWVSKAEWHMISEYTVAWVAAETPFGWDLGLEWIEDPREWVAACGWSTLGSWLSTKKDEELQIEAIERMIQRIKKTIHSAPNRVRYCMNGFVISAGSFVPALTDKALAAGEDIGKVHVDVGGTACKVPLINPYIQKVIDKGRVGKKRKQARC